MSQKMQVAMICFGVILMVNSSNSSAKDRKTRENNTQPSYILSFTEDQQVEQWQVVDDGVMGGASKGKTSIQDQLFKFSGRVSTANNGGFTSVYHPVAELPQTFESVRISIKGDGKPYQLRIRSQVMGYNVVYKIEFNTQADSKQNLSFNLADFQASFRGRIISDAPLLKAETITHVGFLITTKRNSRFTLYTSQIEFY